MVSTSPRKKNNNTDTTRYLQAEPSSSPKQLVPAEPDAGGLEPRDPSGGKTESYR